MAQIIVETRYDPPIDFGNAGNSAPFNERLANCLRIHRVRRVFSLLGRDGIHQTCLFDGPDAESVRIALRPVGYASSSVWAAKAHGPRGATAESLVSGERELIVVERSFDRVLEPGDINAMVEAGGGCYELYQVEWLTSFVANDRRRMICIFAAPDAESVRQAQRRAELAHDLVWTATVFPPTAEERALGPLERGGER